MIANTRRSADYNVLALAAPAIAAAAMPGHSVMEGFRGGLSGPAIRPIAVRMVYECHQSVKIPVIGMGGIMDAREMS